MNKLRWGKFYWSDWSDDPALASCSLAAQGLWMRLLCIAAQGTPYGHVTINGKAPDMLTLAKLVRCKQTQLVRLIDELERKGVAHRDSDRSLISRRMESDWKLTGVRSEAGKRGASARYQGSSADFATANASLRAREDSHQAEQESPPTPRKRGANGRGVNSHKPEMRNGFAASAAADMQGIIDAEAANSHPSGARVVSIVGRAHRRVPQPAGS